MRKIYVLSLFVMLFSFTSCWDSDYEEDFEELKVLATTVGDDDSASGACPVGKWRMPTCNSVPGKYLVYYFGSDGKGYSENPDCNGICTPMRFNFKYTISGDKITYNFTSTEDVICNGVNQGRPSTPSGTFTITYTCLDGGQTLRTEYVNIQTGVRSVNTFERM